MPGRWQLADRTLELERPLGVGIVNVTEDSFFEGARSTTPERAVADGLALAEAGFDLLDVGAVAARSGPPVPAAEEAERLVPAIEGLAEATELPISADTFSPGVAADALTAGAVAINDISGARRPGALRARGGERLRAGDHADRGTAARGPRRRAHHDDPVEHLKRWFSERLEAALGRGVAEEQIVLDPGLDFDLSVADDLEILRRLGELRELGRPAVRLALSQGLPRRGAGGILGEPASGGAARVGDRRRHRAWRSPEARICSGSMTRAPSRRCGSRARSAHPSGRR